MGLSETWLRESNETIYAPHGYNSFVHSRNHRIGGGVAILVDKSLKVNVRNDLCTSFGEHAEAVFVDIVLENNHCLTIGEIYRPPRASISKFIDLLSPLLETVQIG